ncbi:DsbA family protein [Leucobacter sp. G161]|uniref:DsbA family protein n=1 Tax=Leucobacter sp. G161 TaxID=663704 RepID=UPI000A5ED617|nr:DsbA family protein [Leucobacter sp. G161]
MNNTIRIDIWSDIACPWCYIGANRFRVAVEQFKADNPEVEFEIEGHSYELAPDTPLNFEGSRSTSS